MAGVDAGRRPLPFASALKASGVETWGRKRCFWEERAHLDCFFFFSDGIFYDSCCLFLFFCLEGAISKRRMIFRTQQMISLKVELE